MPPSSASAPSSHTPSTLASSNQAQQQQQQQQAPRQEQVLQPQEQVQHRAKPKAATEPNVLNVVLGNLRIKPWYPSFYPEELVGPKAEWLYVCQHCFRYCKEVLTFLGHVVSF